MKRILLVIMVSLLAVSSSALIAAQETAESPSITLWSWHEANGRMIENNVPVAGGVWKYAPTSRSYFNIVKLDAEGNVIARGWTLYLPAALAGGVATEMYVDLGHLPISLLSVIPFPEIAASHAIELSSSLELHTHFERSVYFKWQGETYLALQTAYYLGWEITNGQGQSWIVPEQSQNVGDYNSIIWFEENWTEKWVKIDNYQ